MGASADLAVREITVGFHLLDLDEHVHVFRVREPVAVVPIYHTRFGPWTNRSTYREHLDASIQCDASAWRLIDLESCSVGICPLSLFDATSHDPFPGAVNEKNTRAAWGRITPGFWLIDAYVVYGDDDARCPRLRVPEGVVVSERSVRWELWT